MSIKILGAQIPVVSESPGVQPCALMAEDDGGGEWYCTRFKGHDRGDDVLNAVHVAHFIVDDEDGETEVIGLAWVVD